MALIIVKADGSEDYTTLTAAISNSATEIEIQGAWTSAETTNFSISAGVTSIKATGSSKSPIDADRTTSTHWRHRPTSGHAFTTTVDLTLEGLDIINQSTGTSDEVIRLNANDVDLIAKQCILAFNTRNTQQDMVYINDKTGCTVLLQQCVGWNVFRSIVDSYPQNITTNINSCHFYTIGSNETRSGLIGVDSGDIITANLLNSSFHFHADFDKKPLNGAGSGTQVVYNCFKNKSGNASTDWSDSTGTVTITTCQASMNWTDDNSKSSDGDWVIVTDITGNSPYSLSLQNNAYNEAINFSSASSGAGMTKPSTDWYGTTCPTNTNYDVGPFEFVSGSSNIDESISFAKSIGTTNTTNATVNNSISFDCDISAGPAGALGVDSITTIAKTTTLSADSVRALLASIDISKVISAAADNVSNVLASIAFDKNGATVISNVIAGVSIVALNHALSTINSSLSVENSSVSFGRANDIAALTGSEYFSELTLALTKSDSFDAQSLLSAILNLDRAAQLFQTAIASTVGAVIVARVVTINATTGSIFDVDIEFVKNETLQQLGILSYTEQITLEKIVEAINAVNAVANSTLVANKNIALQLQAQCLALALVNLGYAVTIQTVGSTTEVIITTPASRTIKILFENRTVTIPFENRTLSVRS